MAPALREIGHTKTSASCALLRDIVQPAIAGVLKNDEAINAGQVLLAKTRDDSTAAAPGAITVDLGMDRARLGRVTVVLAHNLQVIRALLARLPKPGSETGDKDVAAQANLEAKLFDIVETQNAALNVLNGELETDALGQMQHEFPTGMGPPIIGKDGHDEGSRSSYLTVAGLPTSPREAGFASASLPQDDGLDAKNLLSSSVRGHTVYDSLMRSIHDQQAHIEVSENAEAALIFVTIDTCRGFLPSGGGASP